MRAYTIILTNRESADFVGRHLPDRETDNRHYYEDDQGKTWPFRKAHMAIVVEQPVHTNEEVIHGSRSRYPISRRNQGGRSATAAGGVEAKDPEGPQAHGSVGVIYPDQEQKHRMVKSWNR